VSIDIILTPADMAWATRIGTDRPHGPEPKWKKKGEGREPQVLDAMAELALCRALGFTWPARNEGPSVDPYWKVRYSPTPGQVKVKGSDDSDWIVALVTGTPPAFKLIGHVTVNWAKTNIKPEDPGNLGAPAHFVPSQKLAGFDPGFHAICGWVKSRFGYWECAWCGARFEWPEGMEHG
jgi:hypothetical protein